MTAILDNSLITRLPRCRGRYLQNEMLCKHTWFGVGGPAEIMFLPQDEQDLSFFLQNRPTDTDICVIGGGSNLLVRDGGISGVVIKLDTPYFKNILVESGTLTCFAGVKNVQLQKTLLQNSLGGLEFICSIPGSIGGLIKTNAGCFGKSISDVLVSARIMTGSGQIKNVHPQDLGLTYRNSSFPQDWIILSVTMRTEKSSADQIRQILLEQKEYRQKKQPYNVKTAGSTFKNPAGQRAWELIKKSGCDSLAVGGARVSEKHCNFLVNDGNATAEDIEKLGDKIVAEVKKHTSVTLEWEVKKMGVRK